MDNPFKSPAVISFCPGILGLERGLIRAGCDVRVAAYVEIEAFIVANLVAGMEAGVLDSAPIWTDAKTFDARPFRGRVHGIIGGYPCPGESLAGLREGHLYKGFIWPSIRRSIQAARPLWCFFENVDDHLSGTYPIVHRSLRNMGYAVEAGIYTAEEVGAPHQRQRLFILAISNGIRHGWINESRLQSKVIGRSKIVGYSKGKGLEIGGDQSTREECKAIERRSKELGNPEKQRSQKHRIISNKIGKEKSEQERRRLQSRITGSSPDKWPAGQGTFQYDWEEKRTVEPGLGCTINGYNYRKDLIRAIGNSVVEQTAELAFIDLLKKHLK